MYFNLIDNVYACMYMELCTLSFESLPSALQVWEDLEGTEIPALRRFIHSNTMARRKILVRKQVRGGSRVRGWIRDREEGTHLWAMGTIDDPSRNQYAGGCRH